VAAPLRALSLASILLLLATTAPAQEHVPRAGAPAPESLALARLQEARWFLEHGPEGRVEDQQVHCLAELRTATYWLQQLPRPSHGSEVARLEPAGEISSRMRRVIQLLEQARQELGAGGSQPPVEARGHALTHLDLAIGAAQALLAQEERHPDDSLQARHREPGFGERDRDHLRERGRGDDRQ
jgi:hypothetical protein